MRRSTTLYLSHGASGEWFIVEPRDAPGRQLESLRRAGRAVKKVRVRHRRSWGRAS